MNFSHVKLIVFDLDGTLYEDTHHFDFYAERIKERLPADVIQQFNEDYLAVKRNEHPLNIGRIYDAEQDLVLVQSDNFVQEAYEWNGRKLEPEQVKERFPDPIVLDFEKMLSVGDPWWIPVSIAAHYGLDGKASHEAFLETRAYMMGPEFEMQRIEGLTESLEAIKEKIRLILLTNSPQPDSEAILKKLGLENVFIMKIFNGEKPTRTRDHLLQIKDQFGVRYGEIMSIGDNYVNEIRPAEHLGCSTIYIDPQGIGQEQDATIAVRSIKEIIPMLEKMV